MSISKEQELLGTIIQKAWEDESFKQELIAEPIAAIEKLAGGKLQIPEGKTLVVRDQTDESTIFINIPAQQKIDSAELSEEQLEAVAGGAPLYSIMPIIPPIWKIDPPTTI